MKAFNGVAQSPLRMKSMRLTSIVLVDEFGGSTYNPTFNGLSIGLAPADKRPLVDKVFKDIIHKLSSFGDVA